MRLPFATHLSKNGNQKKFSSMIAQITGTIHRLTEDSVILETRMGVFYQIFVPSGVLQKLKDDKAHGEEITLYTLYYIEGSVGFGNLVPRLFGFTREIDREFFELFVTVPGLGARKALKSLIKPVNQIAAAIEKNDVFVLKQLPGIGKRLAEKVIAELKGKVTRFAIAKEGEPLSVVDDTPTEIRQDAFEVLTMQLGYSRTEAEEMIATVLQSDSKVESTEDLIRAIYLLRK